MPIVDNDLIDQYAHLHRTKRYGQTSHEFALEVQICILDLKPRTILEYGCGQSVLEQSLDLDGAIWVRYDPAIPELSTIPIERADFIVNTDVLEHIPEQDIGDVLEHMRSLGDKVFFNIATRTARETLPDGNNAHCTIWDADRWREQIARFFPCVMPVYVRPGHSCLFVTWRSSASGVLARIQQLKLEHAASTLPMLKRMERGLRSFRNRLLRA